MRGQNGDKNLVKNAVNKIPKKIGKNDSNTWKATVKHCLYEVENRKRFWVF